MSLETSSQLAVSLTDKTNKQTSCVHICSCLLFPACLPFVHSGWMGGAVRTNGLQLHLLRYRSFVLFCPVLVCTGPSWSVPVHPGLNWSILLSCYKEGVMTRGPTRRTSLRRTLLSGTLPQDLWEVCDGSDRLSSSMSSGMGIPSSLTRSEATTSSCCATFLFATSVT